MAHISFHVPFSALDIGRCSHNENMQNSFGGSSVRYTKCSISTMYTVTCCETLKIFEVQNRSTSIVSTTAAKSFKIESFAVLLSSTLHTTKKGGYLRLLVSQEA